MSLSITYNELQQAMIGGVDLAVHPGAKCPEAVACLVAQRGRSRRVLEGVEHGLGPHELAFGDERRGVVEHPMILENAKHTPMYALCFAAGNPKGAPTAVKIAAHLTRA